MTHDELLAKIEKSEADMCDSIAFDGGQCKPVHEIYKALRAVVELHKPFMQSTYCNGCDILYPCPTIQAIEKELQ